MRAMLIWDGGDVVNVPPSMGEPCEDQLTGTTGERVIELACRLCYDSMGLDSEGKRKGRATPQTLAVILEHRHHSVLEHFVRTVEIKVPNSPQRMVMMLQTFLNRRGVWVRLHENALRVTLNGRAVVEWDDWSERLRTEHGSTREGGLVNLMSMIGTKLWALFSLELPQLIQMPLSNPGNTHWAARLEMSTVTPESDHEKHITLYLRGSRGFCYDSKTEVLTEDGWVPWPKVDGSERFATLNMGTEMLEYQEASAVTHEPYHGEMIRVASKFADMLVTPNHRMVVRNYDTQAAKRGEEPLNIVTADDILRRRVKLKRTAHWIGETPEHYRIPDVVIKARVRNQTGDCGVRTITCTGRRVTALPFARMIGWWLAEGSLDHSPGGGYFTVISQSKHSPHWHDITRCIEEAGFTYSVNYLATCPQIRVNGGRALYSYLKAYSGSSNKAIPPDLQRWGPSYQEELLQGYLAGDGSRSSPGHAGEGHTVSKQLADDLQVAALKAGWSASIRISDRTGQSGGTVNGREIIHRKPVYVVGFARKQGQEPLINHNGKRSVSREHYSGMIHCVTVPNGTLYVRRNGKPCWSGNSHEQVRHRFGISQRSTRFADEHESPWDLHPLLEAFFEDDDSGGTEAHEDVHALIGHARTVYAKLVDTLQDWLLVDIVPDGTKATGEHKRMARKQARGAARGMLGNALRTDLAFTASVADWRHVMIPQRGADAADAEIRRIFMGTVAQRKDCVLGALLTSRYADRFTDVQRVPSADGTSLRRVVPD